MIVITTKIKIIFIVDNSSNKNNNQIGTKIITNLDFSSSRNPKVDHAKFVTWLRKRETPI